MHDPSTSITVVLPVHDNPTGARRSLAALAGRAVEHADLQVVVVDDGSTDDTAAVVAEMLEPFVASQLVKTPNRGPSAARNTGASASSGEYLVFLDANDQPLPGWLASFGRQLVMRPGIAHCRPDFADPAVRDDYGFVLPGCFAVSRQVFDEVAGYDEELRFAENTDLVERVHALCAGHGIGVAHSDEALLAVNDISDPGRYDEHKVSAMSYLLERDAEALRKDRRRRELLARIGAVSAVRSGQTGTPRSLAWTAVRARPTNARNWARLALTAVPIVGRRRWPDRAPSPEVNRR